MAALQGWPALFTNAFHQSRNAMVLVDGERTIVDANAAFVTLLGRPRAECVGHRLYEFVAGGPFVTPTEWRERLAEGRFAGQARLVHAEGREIAVQWGGSAEVATGRQLVLFVALSTSRAGNQFRRAPAGTSLQALTEREREIVGLVALGESGPEIAAELDISHNTVRTHIRNAMTKLDARSRAHLVAKALAEAWVSSVADDATVPHRL